MKYNERAEHLRKMGIDIKLSKQGVEILAEIMSEGCPIKMSCDGYEFINCPLHWNSNKYTCKRCWKDWLQYFGEVKTSGTANG